LFFSLCSEGESSSSKPLSRGTNIFNSSSNIPKSPGGDTKPPPRGFFNNIGQYFSLSTETYRRPETPVFPLEQAAANNQSNTSESEGGDPSQPKSPSSTSVKSPLHKSEITGMSIFTFQFPLQISALFGGASATSSQNNPNLLQEASNPVVERSSPPDSNNNNNMTHRRKSADGGKQSSSSSSRSKHSSPPLTTTSSPHSGKRLSKDILPKELIILDKNGKLYSSLEIFGLSGDHVPIPMSPAVPPAPVKQVTYQAGDDYSVVSTSSQKLSAVKPAETTARGYNTVTNRSRSNDSGENTAGGRGPQTRSVVVKPAAQSISEQPQQHQQPDIEAGGDGHGETGEPTPPVIVTPSTSAIFQGGKFKKEDCVVCLENPMNIVLLPCR
jgi:hypothetical protein